MIEEKKKAKKRIKRQSRRCNDLDAKKIARAVANDNGDTSSSGSSEVSDVSSELSKVSINTSDARKFLQARNQKGKNALGEHEQNNEHNDILERIFKVRPSHEPYNL